MAKDYGKMAKGNQIIAKMANRTSLTSTTIQELPLEKIRVSEYNKEIWGIREEEVDALAEGIKRRGFEGSVGVYDLGNGSYELYDGHMRYYAQKKRDALTIPCHVKPYPKEESKRWDDLISSNMDGREQTIIERARAVSMWEKHVLLANGYTGNVNEALAEHFHVSTQTIKRLKNMLKLTPSLQEKAESGYGYSLLSKAGVLNADQQDELAKRLDKKEDEINRDDFVKMVKDIQNETSATPKKESIKAATSGLVKACHTLSRELNRKNTLTTKDMVSAKEELMRVSEAIEVWFSEH